MFLPSDPSSQSSSFHCAPSKPSDVLLWNPSCARCHWTYLSYILRASSGWQIRSWQKVDTSNFMGAPFQVTFHFESTVAPSGWQDLLWDSTLLKKSQLRIFVVSHCSQRYKLPFRKSCQYDILIDLKCQFLIFGKVPLNQKGHGQRPESPIILNYFKRNSGRLLRKPHENLNWSNV